LCEANRVEYLLGLAKNERLKRRSRRRWEGESTVPTDRTRRPVVQRVRLPDTGELSCARRVVAKAEHLEKGENRDRGDVSE